MALKTPLMLRVEREYGQPLEKLIPDLVNISNQLETADLFGINRATLGYWMLKLGIRLHRRATLPGEMLEVVKNS